MPNHQTIRIQETDIFLRRSGEGNKQSVIFLHGMRFSSLNWEELGTLDLLADKGFDAIAVDLPGYGESPAADIEKEQVLPLIIEALGATAPIIVAPSFSGEYALPVISEHPSDFTAVVAPAPLGIPENAGALKGTSLPFLIIWGDNDPIVPVENAHILDSVLADSEVVILPEGGHPTYLNQTETFHRHLVRFLEKL
ncbi:alpha/beta fold hydrolase [Desulfoluna spongiiphila]|uniref:Abhydrolase domain-containing protein 14 n=1 Tax=Desulfoluna spongiiphila TaxID=419481 RepID=A0A1G5HI84_9BACT|nr:alpha/beta fold hydrolase [Desulfoluna spongiiphila]SCY63555.1 abhydrolase domain-containing protein 14 [Desulfoluna spongiiphila]VVS93463.1 alpha/beta hydrolase fold [Desulfoluna spongiiphila]